MTGHGNGKWKCKISVSLAMFLEIPWIDKGHLTVLIGTLPLLLPMKPLMFPEEVTVFVKLGTDLALERELSPVHGIEVGKVGFGRLEHELAGETLRELNSVAWESIRTGKLKTVTSLPSQAIRGWLRNWTEILPLSSTFGFGYIQIKIK
jgi:hypothetical protein